MESNRSILWIASAAAVGLLEPKWGSDGGKEAILKACVDGLMVARAGRVDRKLDGQMFEGPSGTLLDAAFWRSVGGQGLMRFDTGELFIEENGGRTTYSDIQFHGPSIESLCQS